MGKAIRQLSISDMQKIPAGDNALCSSYAIDCKDTENVLGIGAHAKVYKAYCVNEQNKIIVDSTPYVAKILHECMFDEKEYEILRRYENTTKKPIHVEEKVYLLTKFYEGKPINFKTLNTLTLQQRIDFICKTLLQINLMHHNTPATGSALAHLDLKPDNILLDVSDSVNSPKSHVIDFGEALELEDSDASKESEIRGSPQMIPPEMIHNKKSDDRVFTHEITGHISTKSDIYMIAAVFMMVLGEENPYKNCEKNYGAIKISIGKIISNISKGFFNEGMKNYLLSECGDSNQKIISGFIDRMCHRDFEKRATTDESLKFFISLRNYYKLKASQSENQEHIKIYLAKLILLSSGLWLENIGTTANKKTFEHYSFEYNPQITAAIVKLYNNGLLMQKHVIALAQENQQSEYMARAIIKLSDEKLLTQENLIAISAKGLSHLYWYKDDDCNITENYLNKKTPDQLTAIITHIKDHHDNLATLFGAYNLNLRLLSLAQSKLNRLIAFKNIYKKEHTIGWFSLFRSKIGKKVYNDTLTNHDIKKRISEGDKKSATHKIYYKYKIYTR